MKFTLAVVLLGLAVPAMAKDEADSFIVSPPIARVFGLGPDEHSVIHKKGQVGRTTRFSGDVVIYDEEGLACIEPTSQTAALLYCTPYGCNLVRPPFCIRIK